MAAWLHLAVFSAVIAYSTCVSVPVVETNIGQIQGMERHGVFQFLGIPFAEPPIGENRFAKPTPKGRLSGIYNATYFRPSCPQRLIPYVSHLNVQDEDCLFLNIYTPINASQGPPKSVMVWVHGGSYIYGSGKDYDGTALVSQHDVISVSINYRLGILGFLNTQDENAGGNQGLWDQAMALKWVQGNIAAFGGDPKSVTIFGESAGSGSVTQLAISPFTDGLFQRVIAESGTASNDWAGFDNPVASARKIGRRLGCPTTTNTDLVQCLRQKSAQDIAKNTIYITPSNAFAPTFGTDFLPYTVQELTTTQSSSGIAKRFAQVEFIIGQNSDEAALFLKEFLTANVFDSGETLDDVNGLSEELSDRAWIALGKTLYPNDSNMAEKIISPVRFMYTNWDVKNDGIARTQSLLRASSDTIFTYSIMAFARAHAFLRQKWIPANNTPGGTFVYLFDHRGSWMPMEAWRSGSDHADEIPFVFGLPLFIDFINATQGEKNLSTKVMTYWTNFAKTGDPTSAGVTAWPAFLLGTEKYLKFHVDQLTVGQYLYNNRVEFWLDYFPKQVAVFKAEPIPTQC